MRDTSDNSSFSRFAILLLVLTIGGCKTPQSFAELVGELKTFVSKTTQNEEPATHQSSVSPEKPHSQADTPPRTELSHVDTTTICFMALAEFPIEAWSTAPGLSSYVQEAKGRGLSVEKCAAFTDHRAISTAPNAPPAFPKPDVATKTLPPPRNLDPQGKISSKTEVLANLKKLKSSKSCIGCSFKKANLEGANLQGAKLAQTNMEGVNLSGANLRGADFQNADLWGTNLEKADLQDANFKGARFLQANLKGANLKGAHFQGADLRFVNFDGAVLAGANFQGAKIFGAKINKQQASAIKLSDPIVNQIQNALGTSNQTNSLADKKSSGKKQQTSTTKPPIKTTKQLQKSLDQAGYELLDQAGQAPGPADKKIVPSRPGVGNRPIQKSEYSKNTAKGKETEIASLPPQKYQTSKRGEASKKRKAKKDELRPAYGVATAIQNVGSDGLILAGFRRGQLALLNLSNGKTIQKFKGHTGTIRAIAIHPDGQIAASGADDKIVRLWKIKNGAAIGVLRGHTDKILSLTFSADGKHLLSGGADKTVRVWEVSNKISTRVYEGHRGGVGAIITLPGKPIVFSASNSAKDRSTIKIWNYDNGVPLGSLRGHRAPIYSLVISPDGTKLISGSKDKTIRIWDIKQKKSIKTFGIIDGHRGAIRVLVMSKDGRSIVSGADDRTIIVWNAQTGDIVKKIEEHKGKITGLALSHDGKSVISSSRDKSIRMWSLTGNIKAAAN